MMSSSASEGSDRPWRCSTLNHAAMTTAAAAMMYSSVRTRLYRMPPRTRSRNTAT
jgi:hypothetical protein